MATTLKEIAAKSGVSVTTCSYILGGKPISVTEETRARVLDAANELGYVRKTASIEKAQGRSIAFVVPDLNDMYYAEMAKHLSLAAQDNQRNLLLLDSDSNENRELYNINSIADLDVDGLIISLVPSGNKTRSDLRQALQRLSLERQVKTVIMGSLSPFAHSISADNILGGYMATDHLIKLGHMRIGCIEGPYAPFSLQERTTGWRQALEDHDLHANDDLIYVGNYSSDTGYAAMPYLLEKGVTAIFAQSDMMALGAMRYLQENKIHVPEDISIVGFDDLMILRKLGFSLTTVAQPNQQIARRCVELISPTQFGSATGEYLTVKLTPKLVIRNTTAPVAR